MKQLGFVDVVSYNTILKASKHRLAPVVTNIIPYIPVVLVSILYIYIYISYSWLLDVTLSDGLYQVGYSFFAVLDDMIQHVKLHQLGQLNRFSRKHTDSRAGICSKAAASYRR